MAEQLFIFQYPNKKSEFNFDNAEVVKSCIKPLNQDVKVDFSLNTASLHYDAFKGEQFAIAADGQVSKLLVLDVFLFVKSNRQNSNRKIVDLIVHPSVMTPWTDSRMLVQDQWKI